MKKVILLGFLVLLLVLHVSAYERNIGFEEELGTNAGGSGDRFSWSSDAVTIDNTHVHSGNASAKGVWVEGETSTVKCSIYLDTPIVEGEEIWYRVYAYYPPEWSWQSWYVSKFMRLGRTHDDGKNAGYLGIGPRSDGILRLGNEFQPPGEGIIQQNVGTPVPLTPGKWYSVELYMDYRGNQAGKAMAWIDGELKFNWENVSTLHMDGEEMGRILFASYWNGGAPQDQTQWVDDICVSTSHYCGVGEIDITFPAQGLEYTSSSNSASLSGVIDESLLSDFISEANAIYWKQEKMEIDNPPGEVTVTSFTPITSGTVQRNGSTWSLGDIPLVQGNNYFSVWVYDGDESDPETKKWTDTINIYYDGSAPSQGIIFEDDFDSWVDIAPEDDYVIFSREYSDDVLTASNGGWDTGGNLWSTYGRIDTEVISSGGRFNSNAMAINFEDRHNSAGGFCKWLPDPYKYNIDEIYYRWYIKYDPTWTWTAGTGQKLSRMAWNPPGRYVFVW